MLGKTRYRESLSRAWLGSTLHYPTRRRDNQPEMASINSGGKA